MPLNIFDEYVSFFLKLCVSFFRSVTFRFADYKIMLIVHIDLFPNALFNLFHAIC